LQTDRSLSIWGQKAEGDSCFQEEINNMMTDFMEGRSRAFYFVLFSVIKKWGWR
jgi:hypothetical protein